MVKKKILTMKFLDLPNLTIYSEGFFFPSLEEAVHIKKT